MGSWNGTCGLSQLPIMYNDRIMLFFLEKKEPVSWRNQNAGIVYSTDLWQPICLPLECKYNDYGNVDRVGKVDLALEKFLKKTHCRSAAALITKLSKSEGDSDFKSVEDIGFMMVLKSVWDEFSKQDSYDEIFSHHDDLLKDSKEWYNNLLKSYAKIIELGTEEATKELREKIRLDLSFERLRYSNNSFARCLQNNSDKFMMSSSLHSYEEVLHKFAEECKDPDDLEVKTLLEDLCKMVWFCDAMGWLRKIWQPQSGAGSQSTAEPAYRKLAALMISVIDKREEEYG